jgi:hypothetical protein
MTEEFKKLLLSSESPVIEQENVPTEDEINAATADYPYPDPTPAPAPVVEPTPAPISIAEPTPTPVVESEPAPSPEASAEVIEETPDSQKSKGEALVAGLASAANVAVPTIAATAAFPVGVAGVGLVAAPTGPAAIGAGIVGGVAASGITYWGTAKGQEMLLNSVAPESYAKWNAYLAQAKKDYPYSTAAGQLIPSLATARPDVAMAKRAVSFGRQLLSGKAVDLTTSIGKAEIENLANVAFGAGTELAAETVRQATEEGNFDFLRIAGMAIFGAILNKPTKLGKKLYSIGGLASKEIPQEPIVTDSDEEMGRVLSQILAEQGQPQPKPEARTGGEPSAITEKPKQEGVPTELKEGDQVGEAPAPSPSDSVSGKTDVEVKPKQEVVLPEISPSAKKQAEIDAQQFKVFAALIDEKISGDISKRAKDTETLNLDLLNAAITRDPERALQSLAIALKDELKVNPMTAEVRAREAMEWLTSHGYEERIVALQTAKKTTDELNYQIIAARYMTEQAVNALRAAQERASTTNSEEDLAAAISMFMEVKRVLKPFEAIRGNWGRMGHAFRNLPPEQKNLLTINKLLKQQGISDISELNKQKAQYLVDMIQKHLNNTDPKSFSRMLNMTIEDKIRGAAAEALTGSVMSFVDTGAISLFGGLVESALSPINGTLSGALRLVDKSVKKQFGKASQKDIDMALAEIKASALYYKYLVKRFDVNRKMFWSALKTGELNFSSSLLEEVRGGMPVERGQRIKDPKTMGQKTANFLYDKLGGWRTQGNISSESFGIDPNKNLMGAVIADLLGEYYRLAYRSIVAGDDIVKASNAYAAAHTKLYMEGTDQGLSGDKLNKYISERLDLLMDNNNKLYTRDRVKDEVRKEVQSEGLEGIEAISEITKRTEQRFNTEVGELAKFSERWVKQITAQEDMGVRLGGTNTYGKSIETFFRDHPTLRLLLGVLFIKTPIALARMTGRYIPTPILINAVSDIKIGANQPFRGLKNFQKEYYESFMSGDEFRISQARGRLLTGVAVTSGAAWFAANNIISGNLSANKETRKLQLSRGEIPYAFKIKKGSAVASEIEEELRTNPNAVKPDSETDEHYWFEYKRLHEPTAAIFMAVSDLTQLLKNPVYDERGAADLFGMISMVVGSQVKEKVFLNNIKQWSDLFEGISEDKRGMGRQIMMYLGRRSSSLFTPVSEATDPVIYELNNYSQFIARRMPEPLRDQVFGEDMYLPKAYNLLGEDIDAAITGIPLLDYYNPIYVSTSKKDPVLGELIGLNYNFSSPERIYGKGWDIRNFIYKGDVMSKENPTPEDIREFFVTKSSQPVDGKPSSKQGLGLLPWYSMYGITNLPKAGQDAYDRWQENIGQIKVNGMSIRDSLVKEINSPSYQALENNVFAGEENPRAKRLMGIVSGYRSLALLLTQEEYPDLKKAIATKKLTNMALKAGMQREDIEKKAPTVIDRMLNFPD